MFCKKCNNEIKENWQFCPFCNEACGRVVDSNSLNLEVKPDFETKTVEYKRGVSPQEAVEFYNDLGWQMFDIEKLDNGGCYVKFRRNKNMAGYEQLKEISDRAEQEYKKLREIRVVYRPLGLIIPVMIVSFIAMQVALGMLIGLIMNPLFVSGIFATMSYTILGILIVVCVVVFPFTIKDLVVRIRYGKNVTQPNNADLLRQQCKRILGR